MNKIVNRFLPAGDKFNPELHVRQPGFTYIACESYLEHCESTEKFRKTDHIKHLYRNELDNFFLLIMLHILIVMILPRELFQTRS